MSTSQNDESFLEKKLAIETFQKAIDSYCDILQSTRFTKSVIIRGHPGAENNFILYKLYFMQSQRD